MQTTWCETAVVCELAARGTHRRKGESWASLAAELHDTWTDPVAKAEATARYAEVGELAYQEYAERPDNPEEGRAKHARRASTGAGLQGRTLGRAIALSTRRTPAGIRRSGKRYRVEIKVSGKTKYVGTYDGLAEAQRWRDAAIRNRDAA